MAFAAISGVAQLTALGSFTRSVRLRTILLGVGVGLYGCGVLALVLQYLYTRTVSGISGSPIFDVVATAGYTVDPFIEESVKIAPLVIAGLYLRTRRQLGLTDYLIVGAAIGAGFGLFEAVMRYGDEAGSAIRTRDGWVLPTGLSSPIIPDPASAMGNWLTSAVGSDTLGIPDGPGINKHLVWSTLAGSGTPTIT